ncbi:MAG: catalase [Chitinophagaceae bacterium]|nr:catalase [Oligoflexus sp.]
MPVKDKPTPKTLANPKLTQLESITRTAAGEALTTNHGLKLSDDQTSLKIGARGPTLLEDFHLREKLTHFDHERIPERIVHARGVGAHGYFQAYESLSKYTKAAFLQDPKVKTPVFMRFSTVAGSRGSTDLARDVRGFAIKFYTSEGNYDLVGNNIPVFFIQDAMKFPDLIHAVKPEPHNEIPQAASAHDTFWDFISLMPESMHMIMWVMSDRAIPRTLRSIQGFGVHTFRLINDKDQSVFVKFHFTPKLGLQSVLWDEALKISGVNPDFHRLDLWENIEKGNFPEWEMGIQIVTEKEADGFDFDILDPTKLIPEELVPVTPIGKLVLNRNVDNFFAETEQVAFNPAHLVPGIDFSNDPLLQGRLFSYLDTQLSRLGSPNWQEIPINRPVAPVRNNQRDGHMRTDINKGRVSYQPNTLGGGCPFQAGARDGGFTSFPDLQSGPRTRARGPKFFDHFSQARQFFISQNAVEQDHIVDALRFELSKVETVAIRQRMVGMLNRVDKTLASRVAENLGLTVVDISDTDLNHGVPADKAKEYQSLPTNWKIKPSPALSLHARQGTSIATRKVAVIVADGFVEADISTLVRLLRAEGAEANLVAPHQGKVKSDKGTEYKVDFTLNNSTSVLFDAVFVTGGSSQALQKNANALRFAAEAYRHCKPVAISADPTFIRMSGIEMCLPKDFSGDKTNYAQEGLIYGKDAKFLSENLLESMKKYRFWAREKQDNPPV